MGDKKGGGDADEDPRLDFICEYLTKTMRLKSDKWPKMMGNEENRVMIQDFFNNPKVKIILFNLSAAGLLTPMLTYPSNPKSKTIYFIKRREEVLTAENLTKLLIFGDMAPNPVEELSVLP